MSSPEFKLTLADIVKYIGVIVVSVAAFYAVKNDISANASTIEMSNKSQIELDRKLAAHIQSQQQLNKEIQSEMNVMKLESNTLQGDVRYIRDTLDEFKTILLK